MANMDFYNKHNMVDFLQKPTGSEEFHQIVDFLTGIHIRYTLTANPTIYVSLIEPFWQTVTVKTVNDGEQQLTVTVNGQTFAITKASIRRHLQLADADGPTLSIESQHTPIASPSTLQPTTSQPTSSQEQPSQAPIIEPTTSSLPLYETTIPQPPPPMPQDSPLPGGHTPGSDEGSKKLHELMELCTKLSDKVTSLKEDLKQTKKLYGKAITKLVKKVKHLEDKLKSTTERRKTRLVISDDEEDLVSNDTSKQGRMTETEYEGVEIDLNQTDDDLQRRSIIEEIDLGKGFTLQQLTPTKVAQGEEQSQESSEAKLGVLSVAKILADASRERVKT
ncbi:hypothetical protein Tco_1088430, partial [Tanacetum coccineum]